MYKYGRCTVASNVFEEVVIYNVSYNYEEVKAIYDSFICENSEEIELKNLIFELLNNNYEAGYIIFENCKKCNNKTLLDEIKLKELSNSIRDKHPTTAPIHKINDIKSLLDEMYSKIFEIYKKLEKVIFVKEECVVDAIELQNVINASEIFINNNKRILEKYKKKSTD